MKKLTALFAILLVLLITIPTGAETTVIFEMEDPKGDSYGDGTYTHPQSAVYGDKLDQMLDLTKFTVTDLGEKIEFRLTFALEPDYMQPWSGRGLNFHRIDIYLVTGQEGGLTEPFKEGPKVNFSEPWNTNIKILDWDFSRIRTSLDNPQSQDPGIAPSEDFTVEVMGKDIVVTISKELVGTVDSSTKYYVLVGRQDAFGADNYGTATEGTNTENISNVYDILAKTSQDQFQQLEWIDGDFPTLVPVGGRRSRFSIDTVKIIFGAVFLLVICGGAVWVFKRRR